MFARLFRTNWEATDTVYDAWIMLKGWQREWFDRQLFDILYPDVADDLQLSGQTGHFLTLTPKPSGKRRRILSDISSDSNIPDVGMTEAASGMSALLRAGKRRSYARQLLTDDESSSEDEPTAKPVEKRHLA